MENMKWILSHSYNLLSGFFVACIAYFSPIKAVVNVMVIAIILDLVIGLIAARRKGEGIKSHKLWRTIYKLVFAVVVVAILFAMDKEMGFIQTHRFVAWLITGFEIWSMLESMGRITNHKIFRLTQHFMEDKVKAVTGINLVEDENKS